MKKALLVCRGLYELARYDAIVRLRGSGYVLRRMRAQSTAPKPDGPHSEQAVSDAVLLAACFYWKPVLCLQPPEPMQHLKYTHPFAHRPLVEFLMAVPADVLCAPGEPRKLMRAALPDLWPAEVRSRRSKASFSHPWQQSLRPLAHALLNTRELQLVERGFVDRASVVSRLERLCTGLDCNASQLRLIILLELWLRRREERALCDRLFQAA